MAQLHTSSIDGRLGLLQLAHNVLDARIFRPVELLAAHAQPPSPPIHMICSDMWLHQEVHSCRTYSEDRLAVGCFGTGHRKHKVVLGDLLLMGFVPLLRQLEKTGARMHTPLHDGAVGATRAGGKVICGCIVQQCAQCCRRILLAQDLLELSLCAFLCSAQPVDKATL